MRLWCFAVLAVLASYAPLSAGAVGKGKIILEWWDAAFLEGNRAGYVHTQVETVDKDGHTVHVATVEMRLNVKRFKDTIQLGMDSGTIETHDGRVVGTVMRHMLGKGKELLITGLVKDDMLHLTLDGKTALKPAPWNDEVVGLFRQQLLFQEKNVKPGDSFTFQSFEPTVNLVLEHQVQVKDEEEVELFAGKGKAKLLRVEIVPPRLEKVQLAPLIVWLREDRLPVRSQFEVPGLGKIVLYRTTKANALAPTPVAKLTDIGIGQYVRLTKRLPRPYETSGAVYRVTVRDDEDPASTFARDGRQEAKNARGATFELHVRDQAEDEETAEPGPEYLESSYFINCDDEKVQSLTKAAVGKEKDPWRKARAIERWVNQHVKVESHEALATADHVAHSLEGDCTEFAMLTAAMCRATGIPSRTAVGLIYADVQNGPVFAFHMWTEVSIDGHWRSLDATLGRGKIDAAHLKINDQSWHDTRNMTPLFPVLRVLGRLNIEIVSYKHGG